MSQPENPPHSKAGSFFGAALLAAIPLVSCAAPPLPEDTAGVDTTSLVADWSLMTLGPNDVLDVRVHRRPEVSSPEAGTRVSAEGTISLPLIGEIEVEGRTSTEVSELLEEAFGGYFRSPSVAVSVLEYQSKRFYLFGHLKRTGPVNMDRPLSALEALSEGEQILPGANREQVTLLRRHGDEVEVHRFNAETPGAEGLVQVVPEDLIFVSRAGTGRFTEEALPILQALGYTASQITALHVITDL